MFNEVSSRKDSLIVTLLKTVQMIFLCLIVIVCIFWVLQILDYKLDSQWQNIISSILLIGDIFYGENIKIGSYYIDFSYLSTILVFAFFIYVLNFCIDAKKNLEQQKEIKKEKRKKAQENKLNEELHKKLVTEELKYKYCVVLLNLKAKYEKKGWDDKEDRIISSKELINIFEKSLEENSVSVKYSILEDKLMLEIDNISQLDIKLNILNVLLNKMREELAKDYCIMDWCAAIDTYKYENEKTTRIRRLKNLLELSLVRGILCFHSFKIRYELNSNRKYILVSQGVYNIEDEDLEVFMLKKMN